MDNQNPNQGSQPGGKKTNNKNRQGTAQGARPAQGGNNQKPKGQGNQAANNQ
jgi:hypothetical protein